MTPMRDETMRDQGVSEHPVDAKKKLVGLAASGK